MQQQRITQVSSKVEFNKQNGKLIYLDVAGKLHSLYKELFLMPPAGYRFTSLGSDWDKVSSIVSKMDLLYSVQMNILAKVLPPNLVKASLERFKQPPRGTVLTYSVGHPVFRKEPWVVDMEFVTQLAGYNYNHFMRFRRLIERVLASEYCKRIICWTEAGKKTVMLNLDCERFADKVEVVPLAVRKKDFVKDYDNVRNVKLLFVGSANIPGEFEYKGGKEVLEAFSLLRKKYRNIELVIRSDVPSELKEIYSGKLEGVRLIEGIVPWSHLEQEFKTADVFLFPTHSTPGLAILDAMSYELPVITTDLWANSEMVEDGQTGFVIDKSKKIPYYVGNFIPNWSHYPTSKFIKLIKNTDNAVAAELAEKTSILIEDEALRRRMGKVGRKRIEEGIFSANKRNQKLKKIFDESVEE
jgi:glycosyltransferase involved in cell wall biosynthesis